MKTIDKILKEAWYTKQELLECEIEGTCNWMWGKWGIQWTDELRKLKYFDSEKETKLLNDLDLVSDIHDIKFNKGWFIIAFLIANYELCLHIIMLLHWTNTTAKVIIFILLMLWLNTFGIFYFSWKPFKYCKDLFNKYIP